jgi:hypothetical protein
MSVASHITKLNLSTCPNQRRSLSDPAASQSKGNSGSLPQTCAIPGGYSGQVALRAQLHDTSAMAIVVYVPLFPVSLRSSRTAAVTVS